MKNNGVRGIVVGAMVAMGFRISSGNHTIPGETRWSHGMHIWPV